MTRNLCFSFTPIFEMKDFFIHFLWENLHGILAQISGFVAVWILLYGLSQKDDVKSIKIITVSALFWMINYILLGLIGAILATLIAFVRMYFSLKYKGNMKAFTFLLLITFVVWYFSYDGNIISSLPIIASVAGIVGFQIYSGIKMRLILLSSSFLWLYYSIEAQNISGVINELLVELVMLSTIVRLYLDSNNGITVRERIRILMSQKTGKMRPRIDFWRFVIFRDRKRYLSDDFSYVYEWDEQQLKSTL